MSQHENDNYRRFTSSSKKRLKIRKILSKTQILNKINFPGSEIKFKRALSFTNIRYVNKNIFKKSSDGIISKE